VNPLARGDGALLRTRRTVGAPGRGELNGEEKGLLCAMGRHAGPMGHRDLSKGGNPKKGK